MTGFRALMLGVLGVAAIGYGVKSMFAGVINLGNRQRDFFVSFSDQPGLFLFGLAFMLVLGAGCCFVAWRHFTRDESQR